MRQRLEAVLFDLDGTLLDTAPDFITTMQLLLARHSKPAITANAVRQTVSHGSKALVKLGFGINETDIEFEDLRQQLLAIYLTKLSEKTALFSGMDTVLAHLEQQQIPWGIVTNKPSLYADKILTDLKLKSRSSTTICPDHVSKTKPHPEPMLLACKQINCLPENVIYVGDHRRDIEAGRNANMKTVAASYGYIDPQDPIPSWNADHTIDQPVELLAIINNYRNQA
ncbi:MAG: 2-phosphoglycolate phosphatase [Arenicella sp.]|jgi:2-phosphoglycolate phosphatase